MQGVSESLAGRVAVIHLMGLSRREILGQSQDSRPFVPTPEEIERRISAGGRLTLKEFYRLIWRGSFPAIALDNNVDRDLFYGSYIQTYLQRDSATWHGWVMRWRFCAFCAQWRHARHSF